MAGQIGVTSDFIGVTSRNPSPWRHSGSVQCALRILRPSQPSLGLLGKEKVMKTTLISLAIGTTLSLASSLALADRDDHRPNYRGDYRVENRHQRDDRHIEFSHRHFHPHWHYRGNPHVHDRWCGHRAPAVRFGPHFRGPHPSSFEHGHIGGGLTIILRSALN
jgi:hypothetical protein